MGLGGKRCPIDDLEAPGLRAAPARFLAHPGRSLTAEPIDRAVRAWVPEPEFKHRNATFGGPCRHTTT
jgi:hypothetical protein